MEIPAPAYTTIGAISAAIIAGGISFLVSVLSKDQKTSEFRQSWIDSLRNDVAELVALYILITDMCRVMQRASKTAEQIHEYLSQRDGHFCQWEMAYARIKLRLNPEEHKKLLDSLLALQQLPQIGFEVDSSAVDTQIADVIAESQTVLKEEWTRVKRGEPVFVATKVISLLIILIAFILWAAYANDHLQFEFIP